MCVYLYHPQTSAMASVVIFIEMPEWLWYYDLALDSIFLMGQAQVHMYIFLLRLLLLLF